MPLTINKTSRTNSQINIKSEMTQLLRSTSSNLTIQEIPIVKNVFEHRFISTIFRRMPTIIKTLANICQILDDYPILKIKLDQIQQGTIDCILWNEDRSYPIALDQNTHLNEFRQSIREFLHEYLEFTQEILIISDKNNQINLTIQKCSKYLILLNDYRTKRQSAYNYFSHNHTSEDAMLILTNIDKQQYHELRFITLHLRQFFLKLIAIFTHR